MKNWAFYVSVALAAACLILAIFEVRVGKTTQQLQAQLQQQQNEINSGLLNQNNQQLARNILADMAGIAVTNQRMSRLLADNGYTINTNAVPAAGETTHRNARKTP